MQWLANLSVRRPVLATVLILVLVVIGVVGYLTLGVDKFPRIDVPFITIVTPYPGASPSAVESDVTKKIESAVNSVSGLELLQSTSTEGVSLVLAQFSFDTDVNRAAQDINDHLAAVLRELPSQARPEVSKADLDVAPVAVLAVEGPPGVSTRELTRFVDRQVK